MVRQTTPQKVYEDTEELLERGAEFRDWQSGRLVANITSLSAGLKYWLHESFNKVCSKGAIVAGHLDSAIESCWKQISKAGSYFQQLYEYSDGLLPSHFDAFERKVAWVLLIVLFVAIVCVMAAACRRYSPRWRHKTIEGEPLDSPIGSSPSFSDNQQTGIITLGELQHIR